MLLIAFTFDPSSTQVAKQFSLIDPHSEFFELWSDPSHEGVDIYVQAVRCFCVVTVFEPFVGNPRCLSHFRSLLFSATPLPFSLVFFCCTHVARVAVLVISPPPPHTHTHTHIYISS
jgi:hypothetical protein